MPVAKVFKALGDQTRLDIVTKLSDGNYHTLSALTGDLEITRQGARKHIQILLDAGVVNLQSAGRETRVSLDFAALERGRRYIAEIEKAWDKRLTALRDYVERVD